jgi:ABC-type glycerol-3-phosphate transport system substrate-binding protein
MKSKFAIFIVMLLLVQSLLAACGGGEEEQVTLKILVPEGALSDGLRALAPEYEEETGVKIKPRVSPGNRCSRR